MLLNRNCPPDPRGCCPIVPIGTVIEPVPGKITLLAMLIVGGLPIPVPLATSTWLNVPWIDVDDNTPSVVNVKIPLVDKLANPATCPVNAMTGSPAMPDPFVTLRPAPEEVIDRPAMLDPLVFTWMPVADVFSDSSAPVVVMLNEL